MHRKLERAVIEPIPLCAPGVTMHLRPSLPDIPFYLGYGEQDGAIDSVSNAIIRQISHIKCDDRTILGHSNRIYSQHIITKKRTKKRCVSGIPHNMRFHCCSTIGLDSEPDAIG